MHYYRRLRDLREDNDISQCEIAEKLGITQVQYHRYESGKREIPYHMVIMLAEFYNVSIDYISELSDEKTLKRAVVLSDEEMILLHKYRALSDRSKGRILERLDILYNQKKL